MSEETKSSISDLCVACPDGKVFLFKNAEPVLEHDNFLAIKCGDSYAGAFAPGQWTRLYRPSECLIGPPVSTAQMDADERERMTAWFNEEQRRRSGFK